VAWPESALPVDSDGEPALDELPDDESPVADVPLVAVDVLDVVVVLSDEAACAARLTASVPARLAATSVPVTMVVRRSPVSRSMTVPLIC
jgi:hypothetical protein